MTRWRDEFIAFLTVFYFFFFFFLSLGRVNVGPTLDIPVCEGKLAGRINRRRSGDFSAFAIVILSWGLDVKRPYSFDAIKSWHDKTQAKGGLNEIVKNEIGWEGGWKALNIYGVSWMGVGVSHLISHRELLYSKLKTFCYTINFGILKQTLYKWRSIKVYYQIVFIHSYNFIIFFSNDKIYE